jgi:two-component system response regulator MprA
MPKRILIVDDEPDFAEMVRYRLRDDRYEFEYAQRGMDAINRLTLARPDAVLLDVLLPDMNGLEVCEILKRRSDPQQLPIILISGLDNTRTRTAGQEAGARSFVSKPVDFAQLKLLLEKVLADSASAPRQTDDLESARG